MVEAVRDMVVAQLHIGRLGLGEEHTSRGTAGGIQVGGPVLAHLNSQDEMSGAVAAAFARF